MTTKQLREERARLIAECRRVLDTADRERRKLTATESTAYDSTFKRAEELGEEIRRADALEGMELELRTSTGTLAGREGGNTRIELAVDAERTVLAPADSLERHLTDRGELSATAAENIRGIGFGQILRAYALGARTDSERRALSEGTDSAGGYTVPEILGARLIDRMRKRATVIRAGATTVPLGSDVVNIARVASDPVAAWRLENAAVAESDPTFERVQFTARALAVLVKVSRELIEDSTNIEEALSNAFAQSMAIELDRVALLGSGTAPEPRGVYNTTGISTVSMGVNGAALTSYDPMLDAIQALQDANAGDPSAAIMAPRTVKGFNKLKDTTNQPLRRPQSIESLAFLGTTQIPVNQTQGTSSDCSTVIVGNWADCMIGVRSTLRVETLKERYADNMQIGFLAHLRYDVQMAHPESFARVTGIKP